MSYKVKTRVEVLTEWLLNIKGGIEDLEKALVPVPTTLLDQYNKVRGELNAICFLGSFNLGLLSERGLKIKLEELDNYWVYDSEKETIMIHEIDGSIVDARSISIEEFVSCILSNSWEIATIFNCPVLFREEGIELQ